MRPTKLCLLLLAGALLAPAQDATRLRRDVDYLCSPELLGRETGQPGCVKAATYLANRMRDLGLSTLNGAHMGGESPYHYTYTLGAALSPTFAINGKALVPGEDYEVYGEEALVDAPILDLGYGLQDADQGWDDYAGVDASGCWVLVKEGHPATWGRDFVPSAVLDAKAEAAARAGAVGLILRRAPAASRADWTTEDWNRAGVYAITTRKEPRPPTDPRKIIRIVIRGGKAVEEPEEGGEGFLPGARRLGRARLEPQRSLAPATAADIVGVIPGTDAQLRSDYVLVSAHYDHIGGSSATSYFPGADDNASGAAGLMELATLLRDAAPKRSILFVACSGEEKGLLGSDAFAADPPVDRARIVANLNLDMIGRNATEDLYVTPAAVSGQVNTLVSRARDLVKTKALKLNKGIDQYWRQSDHYSFAQRGIPVVFFNSGMHGDLHEKTDTPDRLNVEKMVRVLDLARDLVLDAANAPSAPVQVPASEYNAWTWPVVGQPTDTTAPKVDEVKVDGASGTLTLRATATDNVGVVKVDFQVDGQPAGSDSTAPYELAFDSTKLSNGTHTLKATAFDAAGNAASSSATFAVDNGGGGRLQETEPNDSLSAANAVPEGTTEIRGTMKNSSDRDHFRLSVGRGQTLKAGMSGPTGSAFDYDLYLLNASGRVLAKSESATCSEKLAWTNRGSGTVTVVLQVKSYRGSSTTQPYVLTLGR